MNEPPAVSVVVTSYNYGRFLSGAIDSVLAQHHPIHEVVIVDDGSTDDTQIVAAHYASVGVRYVYQPNAGAAQARNAGIAVTDSELVAFLDADDVWLPDKISRQVAHMRAHPAIALVSCHAYATDEQLRVESVVHAAETPADWILEQLLVRNVVLNPSCVVARRAALERVGGFSELKQWEDWDTWLRVAARHPIGFVPDVLAKVRRHTRGLSPRDGYEQLALDRLVFDRNIGSVRGRWKRKLLRRRARSMSYFHAAQRIGEADRGVARQLSRQALLLDPTELSLRKLKSVLRTHAVSLRTQRFERVHPR